MSEPQRDRELEDLLGRAAPRADPPEAVRARVLDAVALEWRARKRRRWRLPMALAASLLLGAVAVLLVTAPRPAIGVRITDNGGVWIDGVLRPGVDQTLTVPVNAVLETEENSRLVTAAGVELRLRGGSRVVWLESTALSLQEGAVYVATGGRSQMHVRTPMGVVRDIGTTFLVTYDGAVLEVAMRDGEVAIDTDYGMYQARSQGEAGDVVTVASGRIRAGVEPTNADRWAWIHSVHPGYAERNVARVLRQISTDLGLQLEFASSAAEARARTSRLEGDLRGLPPPDALDVVLAATGLVRVPDPAGTVRVDIQSPTDRQ